jgi:hypothetical protein
MTSFREFYVQPGAGSNFIAGKCIWTNEANLNIQHGQDHDTNLLTNEFYFQREKVWNDSVVHTTGSIGIEIFESFEADEDLILETKRMKPLLIELHEYINTSRSERPVVINNIEHLWRGDWTMHTHCFFERANRELEQNERATYLATQAQDFFAQCREYYFKLCEQHNWKSHIITHQHPYDTISPRIKLPKNFKSLAMELDEMTHEITRTLDDIKNNLKLEDFRKDNFSQRSNSCTEFADDIVSYKKIFIENNEDEIRKMYEFFGNEEYFDENKMIIMKEYKEYNDNNMKLIQRVVVE